MKQPDLEKELLEGSLGDIAVHYESVLLEELGRAMYTGKGADLQNTLFRMAVICAKHGALHAQKWKNEFT